MWVAIHLNCHQVWDEVLWSVTATWRDDEASEPVTIQRSGRAAVGGLERLEDLLDASVRALLSPAAT